jgi:prepilin-type processing-associated H-X9-DG protein
MGTTTLPNNSTTTGIFSCGGTISYSIPTVTDGTSNTVAFAEGAVGDQTHFTMWRDGVAWTANAPSAPPNCSGYYDCIDAWANQSIVLKGLQACAAMWTSRKNAPAQEDKGWRWAFGAGSVTIFNTIAPPSSPTYPFSACRTDNYGGGVENAEFQNANSFHPGGCNVGLADGSVRFIKSSIAIKTWWSLGTRSGGEIISSDSY